MKARKSQEFQKLFKKVKDLQNFSSISGKMVESVPEQICELIEKKEELSKPQEEFKTKSSYSNLFFQWSYQIWNNVLLPV